MSKTSRKFKVPDALANLYDFANSLDLRRFTHHGVQRVPSDEFMEPGNVAQWMSARGLSAADAQITPVMLQTTRQLRSAIRGLLECESPERRSNAAVHSALNEATMLFPLVVEAPDGGNIRLRPGRNDALSGLATVVAELYGGAANGTLDRLKCCAAEECRRVFFDRSKPGSRRWCTPTLCGNRSKTRTYRERHRGTAS